MHPLKGFVIAFPFRFCYTFSVQVSVLIMLIFFDLSEEGMWLMNTIPDSVTAFLQAHSVPLPEKEPSGAEVLKLTHCFEALYPAPAALDPNGKAWLSAMTDFLCSLDERLYHLYRPAADLFRHFMAEAALSADPEDPAWKDALSRGSRMGAIDPELLIHHPHKN